MTDKGDAPNQIHPKGDGKHSSSDIAKKWIHIEAYSSSWKELERTFPFWLVTPINNIGDAGSSDWVGTCQIWLHGTVELFSNQIVSYPKIDFDRQGESALQKSISRINKTLDLVYLLLKISLWFRAPLKPNYIDCLVDGICKVLVQLKETGESSNKEIANGGDGVVSRSQQREIEKKCRAIAFLIGTRLAYEGRIDLSHRLAEALQWSQAELLRNDYLVYSARGQSRREPHLAPAEEWRLNWIKALNSLVVGDFRDTEIYVNRLVSTADFVTTGELGVSTGQAVDDYGYAYVASIVHQMGKEMRAPYILSQALRTLHAMPYPNDDDSSDENGNSRSRYDYHLRSRESWARFARVLWFQEFDHQSKTKLRKELPPEFSDHAKHRADLMFLEEQAAFRGNARIEFKSARDSAKANQRPNGSDHLVRQFPALVETAAVPVFKSLAMEISEAAYYLRHFEPDYALSLAFRYWTGQDEELQELARTIGDHKLPRRTRFAAARFLNSSKNLLLAKRENDDAQIDRASHFVETSAGILAVFLGEVIAPIGEDGKTIQNTPEGNSVHKQGAAFESYGTGPIRHHLAATKGCVFHSDASQSLASAVIDMCNQLLFESQIGGMMQKTTERILFLLKAVVRSVSPELLAVQSVSDLIEVSDVQGELTTGNARVSRPGDPPLSGASAKLLLKLFSIPIPGTTMSKPPTSNKMLSAWKKTGDPAVFLPSELLAAACRLKIDYAQPKLLSLKAQLSIEARVRSATTRKFLEERIVKLENAGLSSYSADAQENLKKPDIKSQKSAARKKRSPQNKKPV